MLFIHIGSGTLRTMYGNLDFKYGDYLIIPRGTTYQIDFDGSYLTNGIYFYQLKTEGYIETKKMTLLK